jgi:hypothetical protein
MAPNNHHNQAPAQQSAAAGSTSSATYKPRQYSSWLEFVPQEAGQPCHTYIDDWLSAQNSNATSRLAAVQSQINLFVSDFSGTSPVSMDDQPRELPGRPESCRGSKGRRWTTGDLQLPQNSVDLRGSGAWADAPPLPPSARYVTSARAVLLASLATITNDHGSEARPSDATLGLQALNDATAPAAATKRDGGKLTGSCASAVAAPPDGPSQTP